MAVKKWYEMNVCFFKDPNNIEIQNFDNIIEPINLSKTLTGAESGKNQYKVRWVKIFEHVQNKEVIKVLHDYGIGYRRINHIFLNQIMNNQKYIVHDFCYHYVDNKQFIFCYYEQIKEAHSGPLE